MRREWLSRVLLLFALAEMAWAQNQIAVPSTVTGSGVAVIRGINVQHLGQTYSPDVYGWNTHFAAPFVLIALAALFLLDLKLNPTWTAWRYWIALAALIFIVLPIDQTAIVAIPSFVLALVAASMDKRQKGTAPTS